MNWIKFADQLPQIDDNIEIQFDNGTFFGFWGKIRGIERLDDNWFSLNGDQYVDTCVNKSYFWRKV